MPFCCPSTCSSDIYVLLFQVKRRFALTLNMNMFMSCWRRDYGMNQIRSVLLPKYHSLKSVSLEYLLCTHTLHMTNYWYTGPPQSIKSLNPKLLNANHCNQYWSIPLDTSQWHSMPDQASLILHPCLINAVPHKVVCSFVLWIELWSAWLFCVEYQCCLINRINSTINSTSVVVQRYNYCYPFCLSDCTFRSC